MCHFIVWIAAEPPASGYSDIVVHNESYETRQGAEAAIAALPPRTDTTARVIEAEDRKAVIEHVLRLLKDGLADGQDIQWLG